MKTSLFVSSIPLLVWALTLLGCLCVGDGSGGASGLFVGREKVLLWWTPLNTATFWLEQEWWKAVLHRMRLVQKVIFAGHRLRGPAQG